MQEGEEEDIWRRNNNGWAEEWSAKGRNISFIVRTSQIGNIPISLVI